VLGHDQHHTSAAVTEHLLVSAGVEALGLQAVSIPDQVE